VFLYRHDTRRAEDTVEKQRRIIQQMQISGGWTNEEISAIRADVEQKIRYEKIGRAAMKRGRREARKQERRAARQR
jgi:hypothetical protein